MTPKFIQLLEKCITDGVILGHTRAYKHNDFPSKADINESIVREVLNEVHEWFDFDEKREASMTKEDALKTMMLLSALESWSFSLKQPIPDYLHGEDLARSMEVLEKFVLKEKS